MSLELDHVFCFVRPDGEWRDRLEHAGWVLDEGIEHSGQGTRNRRLLWPEQFLELIWLSSRADAEQNAVRLDRRADWRTTGASPFGIILRGEVPAAARDDFWLYRPPYAPAAGLWIHRANQDTPAQPLVVVMEAESGSFERFRPRTRLAQDPHLLAHRRPGSLLAVRVETTAPPLPLLDAVSPRVEQRRGGRQRLEVVVGEEGGAVLEVTEALALVG